MDLTIAQLVKELFGIECQVILSRPDPRFGDYATNVAMQLAKPVGRSPRDIAEQLVHEMIERSLFDEVTVAGPGFINIRVNSRYLADLLENNWTARYGTNTDGAGKLVIVEYPSQNMAKPYSVGHLRPGNQGWAARQLMIATGWKVMTDNHLGDYGTPLGIWIVGFLRFSSPEKLENRGVYELGDVYIKTKKALKEEAENGESKLAEEVQQWLLKLEHGDPEAVHYSQRFNQISLKHIHAVMERLGISTDYELGEAFFAPKGKAAVQSLLQSGIATENSDGSVVIPLDEFGIDVPLLVQKSNGAALYATTDLATILYREEKWKPDRVIYAVGSEQQFYFTQLIALAKKLGIETELIHLWFGVIDQKNEDGKREKMSSRKGVVLMEELLDQAEARAARIVEGKDVHKDDITKIAIGAIKFSDFTADRRTNILFDWDTIFALTGYSGPYIQYAGVRVQNILRDNQTIEAGYDAQYHYEQEKMIISKLLEYPTVIRLAARDLEPHKIATYLYELAREINRYYESTPVATGDVTEQEKRARLHLLEKVSYVFTHGLDILGIAIPSRM